MRKIFSFLISFLILAIYISPTLALDYYDLDERQLESTGCTTAYSGYYRNQTFKMDHNVLTKVAFEMKNRNGGNVTLTVKDEVTSETVFSMSKRMGSGTGWEEFDLIGDALGYIVEPERTYSMWVGTDYYSGEAPPCWTYTSIDMYDKGVMRQGTTPSTGDFTFAIRGYTEDIL
jgi:hypothetical protein